MLHPPLCAAGCGNASPHYLRQLCMIPWHDLGSSPRRAASPSRLLPPLHHRRLFSGEQQLPAMRSAAPLHLPAAAIGVLLLVPVTPHTDSPACSSSACDIGTEGASHKCQNQEWPFAGVSLSQRVCVCVCVFVCGVPWAVHALRGRPSCHRACKICSKSLFWVVNSQNFRACGALACGASQLAPP